jgi:hypothetical protein
MSDNKELLTIAVIAAALMMVLGTSIPSSVLASTSIAVAVMTKARMATMLKMIAAAAMMAVILVAKTTVKMMKIAMIVVVIMMVPTQAAASLKRIWENIQHAFQIYPQTTAI